MVSPQNLAEWVQDARQRTIELVADFDDNQIMGPDLDIVNPPLWEIGHMAWFQEKWVLRQAGQEPMIRDDVDALYDSIAIAHDTRWSLPLPSREDTLKYLYEVRDRTLESLGKNPSEEICYHTLYTVYHEDMHTEAFTYTRQTLAYQPPVFSNPPGETVEGGSSSGDVEIAGGEFLLGATQDTPFAFDNEKWAHPVQVAPFAIARSPVTQAEYLAFVEDNGYTRQELWTQEGWEWRLSENAEHPVYWRKENGDWLRRHFDQWGSLEPHLPVIHINWYEAQAYCRWANRRLPTEAEWELAAGGENKHRFPWGQNTPTPSEIHMDWQGMGCSEVGAYETGDSSFGCRQMLGNVWEWTSDTFRPYPGFVTDPYVEYSEPWFETRKVLRGGSWATRSRMLWNTWRNFFTPERRDVFAGFRTCAIG
ncbi:MAG: selenoneine synthase SenA [bacterium]|nr:selenoneine synthase SenA [bacterium]